MGAINFGLFAYSAWMIRKTRVSIIKNREKVKNNRDSLIGEQASIVKIERDPSSGDRASRDLRYNRSFVRSISQATSMTKRSIKRDVNKESMSTNFKLFVAMGLTWITEIVTGLYEKNACTKLALTEECIKVELMHFINCLNIFLGPIIFLVFVKIKQVKSMWKTCYSGITGQEVNDGDAFGSREPSTHSQASSSQASQTYTRQL